MQRRYTHYFLSKTVLIVLLLTYINTYSQSDTSKLYRQLEENLQEMITEGEIELDEGDFMEELEGIYQHNGQKINLNNLSPDIAFQLLSLTEYQYYQLQLYIENYGQLTTIYELGAIDGFSDEDIQRLSPYIMTVLTNNYRFDFKQMMKYAKHEVLLRYGQVLEKQAGYDPNRTTRYLGAPFRFSFRYKLSASRHLSIGIAGEKDAGEQFFRGSQKQGFDHYAFHINIKEIKFLKSFTIGDYRLNFGQGLVVGSSLLGGKGAAPNGIRKFPTNVQALTSMNEGEYFKGVAVQLGNATYQGTVFYGMKFYDGKLINLEDTGESLFDASLSVKGYHRTNSEIAKKNSMHSHTYGFDFLWRRKLFRISVRALASHFSAEVLPNDALYRLYDFSGKFSYNAGIDYHLLLGRSILFGEWAIGQDKGVAMLQGFIFTPSPRMKLAILFRHYNKHYIALYGKAFGENSKNKAETGVYITSDIILSRKIVLSFYSDFYRFAWLRYRIDKPVSGLDLAGKFKISLYRNMDIQLRYTFKIKEENGGEDDFFNRISTLNRHKGSAKLNYTPLPFLKLSTAFDIIYNVHKFPDSKRFGVLFYQDVGLSTSKIPLDIKCRIALFDTDSYEERLYAYEHDLYYSFNVSGYYYRGWRGYLMIKYKYKFVDFWLRISRTFYIDRQTIGSGTDEIDGPGKTEIKLQALFRL